MKQAEERGCVMTFRNIDVSPDAPVEEWGFEGMLCALERGDIHPQLADVFRNALNLEKLSNQPVFRETQDAFSKRLATQEQYGQGE